MGWGSDHKTQRSCGGGDVCERIISSKKPFSEQVACKIMKEILQGLYHLHARDILHLDIKVCSTAWGFPSLFLWFLCCGFVVCADAWMGGGREGCVCALWITVSVSFFFCTYVDVCECKFASQCTWGGDVNVLG